MNKSGIIAGAVGIILGGIAGWFLSQKKNRDLIEEKINNIDKEYEYRKKNAPNKEKKAEEKTVKIKPDISKVAEKIKGAPESTNKRGPLIDKAAYVISPDSFGEYEEYSKICMTYYAGDDTLVNEEKEPIRDIDALFGFDPITHIGEYEPDSIHVRDDVLKCDYEILKDEGRYSDDPRHILYENKEE